MSAIALNSLRGCVLVTITEFVLLAFLVVANGFAFSHTRRIQELERKINLVLSHLGIDPDAEVPPSSHVIELASDPRHRIAAIKAYREQTGAGIREAKAVIDKIVAKGAGG
jgi:ribosomal protein L7/L12